MDKENFLRKAKAFARERHHGVTWNDVREEFKEDLEEASVYIERRLAGEFEHWLTRQRLRKSGGGKNRLMV